MRGPPVLEYAGHDEVVGEELVITQLEDGGVTIGVPTRRRSLRHVFELILPDAIGVVFLPITLPLGWLAFRLFASRRPRAVLQLTAVEFVLTETSDGGFGWHTITRSWPRERVAELHRNRFGRSIWLRVPGEIAADLLGDLPPAWIERIAVALEETSARLTAIAHARALDGRRAT